MGQERSRPSRHGAPRARPFFAVPSARRVHRLRWRVPAYRRPALPDPREQERSRARGAAAGIAARRIQRRDRDRRGRAHRTPGACAG